MFSSSGIRSVICRDASDVMGEINGGAGALLLVEEALAGNLMRSLSDYIDSQATWSDLPILLLTRSGADSSEVHRAVRRLGNVTLIERPVRTVALVASVKTALRARERQYLVRDADQRKDEFLATLAHELRNPLAPIRTSMSILQHLHPDTPRVNELRRVVERQVTHLTRLVDDLLDVARITTGKVVLKEQIVPLRSVIDHALEIAGSAMQAKSHRFETKLPEIAHLIKGDPARLVQTLANLLGNAAKFTPPGGQIVLAVSVDGADATFTVRDNGIGMEEKSLLRVFELFEQTPVPGEAPTGLGIGLSLARQFSEMHGGTLRAFSGGVGQGSEFTLKLPIVMQQTAEPPAEVLPSPPAMFSPAVLPGLAARRVLVVDDNFDAANTLEALLDMDGFTVRTVYNGVDGVAAAESFGPDVVVMDIGMPGMDGYAAARAIREQACLKGHAKGIMLIALTGWGQPADRRRASEAGFDHHLVKPVDYPTLLQCMQASPLKPAPVSGGAPSSVFAAKRPETRLQ
jgi:signal transduction histidine kinase/ActR/RegA family two-component response regulator